MSIMASCGCRGSPPSSRVQGAGGVSNPPWICDPCIVPPGEAGLKTARPAFSFAGVATISPSEGPVGEV
jgi:hypothetical protein